MDKPETKIVISERGDNWKYECSNCDFKTDIFKKAVKHQKEFKHEFWVRRSDCISNQ